MYTANMIEQIFYYLNNSDKLVSKTNKIPVDK